MTEAEIQADILRYANSRRDVRLFRNSVGVARMDDGRILRYGLMVGSGDLIGWWQGRFLSVEVKSATGRVNAPQQCWLDAVNRAGGLAIVARSVDEVRAALPPAAPPARYRREPHRMVEDDDGDWVRWDDVRAGFQDTNQTAQ